MLRNIASTLADQFDHPLLAGFIIFGALLIALGFALNAVSLPGVPQITAGWLAVYGILSLGLGTAAYLILFVAKYVSIARDKAGPAA